MAWDAVMPHVHLEKHRHLSSLVERDETPLSDHLPEGFPPPSAVWTKTGPDCGDLMLKLKHSCLPTVKCNTPWLLIFRAEAIGRLSILNSVTADISKSDNLPKSQMSHTKHTYTHMQKDTIMNTNLTLYINIYRHFTCVTWQIGKYNRVCSVKGGAVQVIMINTKTVTV